MLYNKKEKYILFPFECEKELEKSILECKEALFGEDRFYIDIKKKIGVKGKTNNIPDGYLLDLSSASQPKIFTIENELSTHHKFNHIAVQLLEFSLSYETSKLKIKNIIKNSLKDNKDIKDKVASYAMENGYGNIDFLLESIIYENESFNILLIIDELDEELETLLYEKLKFPVEVKTLKRYKNENNEILYEFEPFYEDVIYNEEKEDIAEIDTIIVPARKEGFNEVFLGEDCWYAIRINNTMIPKIKYIGAYQVKPVSAITHVAEVNTIKQYKSTNKYIVYFKEPAKKITEVKLGSNKGKSPYSPRYCSYSKLKSSKTLDDLF